MQAVPEGNIYIYPNKKFSTMNFTWNTFVYIALLPLLKSHENQEFYLGSRWHFLSNFNGICVETFLGEVYYTGMH